MQEVTGKIQRECDNNIVWPPGDMSPIKRAFLTDVTKLIDAELLEHVHFAAELLEHVHFADPPSGLRWLNMISGNNVG